MSDDPGNDPGAIPGNQPAPGNQPLTINAELLGEFKDDPVFKPFEGKGLGDVFKSYKHAQTLVGAEKIPIPAGKLNTPENWAYVFDKLGRPKAADGYKFDDVVAAVPEHLRINQEIEDRFKEAFHAAGLLPKQAQAVYGVAQQVVLDAARAAEASQAARAEETEAVLMRELGTKERYDEYVRGADAVLARFGGSPADIAAFSDKYGNDPIAIKILGNVARAMLEDSTIRGDQSPSLLSGDAKQMANDIINNKQNKYYEAYWDNSHPQHAFAVEEVTRLLGQG